MGRGAPSIPCRAAFCCHGAYRTARTTRSPTGMMKAVVCVIGSGTGNGPRPSTVNLADHVVDTAMRYDPAIR